MEKIYIIKDTSDFVADSELYENIFLTSENLSEDWHFHDFVVKLFKENNPSKLVIPLDINDNPFDGLLLGLHIRLNNDLTHDQKCIPIIFISEKHSFESIFSDPTLSIKQNRALPHYLLTTPNIYLEKPNLDIILAIFELNKPMSIFDYKHKLLDSIKILPSETTGKHSLANIWGAFRLAQTTGHTELLNENTELLRKQKDLYFKYVSANSGIISFQASTQKITIDSKQKNILLIDDEANKGWDVVLKAIFGEANFEVVGKEINEEPKSFINRATESALKEDENKLPKWDLILLDLRLDENEDKGENANKLAKEYSGAILLDGIKKVNKGTQVIMFTASNKAWNMRDLIEMGADGFFIKESPEYSQDNGFSLNNYKSFEKQVDECFEKDFLRDIFIKTRKLKGKLEFDKRKYPESFKTFIQDSRLKLEHTFYLLTLKNTQRTMEFALFNYFQIIEDYANLFTFKNDPEAIAYKTISDARNRTNPHKIFWKNSENKVVSHYALTWDWYDFMKRKDEKDKAIINIEFRENPILQETILSVSLKLAVILNIQLSDISSIEQLNELIYIRNNTIIHSGSNFDKGKRKVEIEDIKLIFGVIYKLIYNSF